jgi:hypothetical protein
MFKFSPARHVVEQPTQARHASCGPCGQARPSRPAQAARRDPIDQPRRPGARHNPSSIGSQLGSQKKQDIRTVRVWKP